MLVCRTPSDAAISTSYMSKNWHNFISQYTINDLQAADSEALKQQRILTDLDNYGLIEASGDDAATFLQNQLSNDTQLVTEDNTQLNSYCTPKGRMLTVFRLFQMGDKYYLRMPKSLLEPVMKRLQMYILRSKVALRNTNEELRSIGVAGPGISDLLRSVVEVIPEKTDTACRRDPHYIIRIPGTERFEIITTLESGKTLWTQLQDELQISGQDGWPLLDIVGGIPTVYPETVEHFVPQMANLHLVNGVSFKKGCYPGQEVVARMQYRGTLKRRMHLISLATDTPPIPGSQVVSVKDGKTHDAGEIVDARQINNHTSLGLAVLQINSLDQPLHIGDHTGPPLKLLELPYDFD